MKNFKIITLTILLTTGFFLPSCDDEIDSCDGVDIASYQYFDIEGVEIQEYKSLNIQGVLHTSDTVALNDLDKIYIDYLVDYTASNTPRNNWSFSFMPTANACSILPGTKGSKEEALVDFTITTLNDFDTDHLANSNINDLFDYHGGYLDLLTTPIPLTQFLNDLTGNLQEEDMILELKKAPEINSEFKIKVAMELSTGEEYEFEMEPIVVIP